MLIALVDELPFAAVVCYTLLTLLAACRKSRCLKVPSRFLWRCSKTSGGACKTGKIESIFMKRANGGAQGVFFRETEASNFSSLFLPLFPSSPALSSFYAVFTGLIFIDDS